MIKTYQGTIYPWNCDHMDHMDTRRNGVVIEYMRTQLKLLYLLL